MSNIAIKVEGLSKVYVINHENQEGGYTALRDVIAQKFRSIPDVAKKKKIEKKEDFFALKDVNFEINKGDRVGIIGRNGAGKSTLLKILSRITVPTTGRITVKGRVASLLEVGTGFHPELTGRENIFLNGAILGMSQSEIRKKFDEIVDFAEVEQFLDTPVKRYSSGMYVKLAFAVSAFLEPEIIVVDEVLAVGDAQFQKKCLGKMNDVSKNDGRTILFVSHNMTAVKQLCDKGIFLKKGMLSYQGTQEEAVKRYQTENDASTAFEHIGDIQTAPGNENVRVLKFKVRPLKGETISISTGFEYALEFYNKREGINLDATFELRDADETIIFHNGEILTSNKDSQKGLYTVKGIVPPNLINAGSFHFNLSFGENQRYELYRRDNILQFDITNEALGIHTHRIPGIMRMPIKYTTSFRQNR
jgi:lipopolysaccharide transport system ATP-binding protein